MRKSTALVTLFLLTLGCLAASGVTALLQTPGAACPEVPLPAAAARLAAPAPAPRLTAPAPAPHVAEAPTGPGLDAALGFEGAPIGRPYPAEVPFDESSSYNDGLVTGYCTSHFRTFEDRPIRHLDIFEACCGGGVSRVHMHLDDDGGRATEAILARLARRYGHAELYFWDQHDAYRFTGASFELRVIVYDGPEHYLKLIFTTRGDSDWGDSL